jgi:ATP-dependent helicase/nuclease subunit A
VAFDLELPAPRCVSTDKSAKPTDVGSATHLVLQYLDFTNASDAKQIQRQLEAFVARKLILETDANIVDVGAILWLTTTELGQLLQKHHTLLRRELPVYFPAAIDGRSEGMDRQMIRGRLDVMIPLPDGLVLADYKTDRVTAQTVDARVDFYRAQMTSYAEAIARIAKTLVTKTYLAFLSPRILKTI